MGYKLRDVSDYRAGYKLREVSITDRVTNCVTSDYRQGYKLRDVSDYRPGYKLRNVWLQAGLQTA